MQGFVHSIETMGLLDGRGHVRYFSCRVSPSLRFLPQP